MPKSRQFEIESRERGFSAIELLVVIIIIAILAAIVVPSLLQSKRAANETIVKARLSNAAAAESTYRSSLGRNTYASLLQLRTTTLGGVSLLPSTEMDASGNALTYGGWTIGQLESPTTTTFGIGMTAAPSTQGKNRYCVFEDGVVRSACATCQCTRTSNPISTN
ncbi:MAG TPA: prepilin-type N-terminal cleavage/methylation domain-containing protein [Blastocatellia bacterium]|nr:prepilin-type N-terminal cleavage/methylation domain-containing protein [Blastocatellia bacterium]